MKYLFTLLLMLPGICSAGVTTIENNDTVSRSSVSATYVNKAGDTMTGPISNASQPYVNLRTASSQGCQGSGACSVYWDTEVRDTQAMWVVGSSATITVPAGMTGLYSIQGVVLYDASATAGVGRYATINFSSESDVSVILPTVGAANAVGVPFAITKYLAAGETITIQGRHDIGSNLNLLGGCHLSVTKIW